MKVELQDVEWMIALRMAINTQPLDKVEWFYNGEPVQVSPEEVEEWKFMGLTNCNFAEMELLPKFMKRPVSPIGNEGFYEEENKTSNS